MTTHTKFLIAKYIPDMRRMEPRNVGIILWVRGKSYCKFLSPSDAGEFVNDRATYERWTAFWRKQVKEGEVCLARGEKTPASSEEFLSALRKTQQENYALDDGGILLEKIPARDAASALDYLFHELVAASRGGASAARAKQTLETGAEKVLAASGLSKRDDYTPHKEVKCDFKGIELPLTFDHCIGNGRPDVVLQNVRLGRLQNLNSAAWMFERVKESYKEVETGAIVNTAEMDGTAATASPLFHVLEKLATVIDLANEKLAIKTAKQLVK